MAPRSVRNHNPGNIRRTAIRWDGAARHQRDPEFVQFADPVYGFRAMARILRRYRDRGTDTVAAIVSTWAPPGVRNHTAAYIDDVAGRLDVAPHQTLDLAPGSRLEESLIRALAIHETGYWAWNDDQLRRGIALA